MKLFVEEYCLSKEERNYAIMEIHEYRNEFQKALDYES